LRSSSNSSPTKVLPEHGKYFGGITLGLALKVV
jgi:hypothetical protein